MILPIFLYGQQVLREVAEDMDLSSKDEIKELAGNLWETLAQADGCGLAAPQVGISKRVCVVDGTVVSDTYPYLKDFKRTFINPKVIETSSEQNVYSEGCLSVPGIYADVRRPARIKVEYFNEDLEKVTEEFDNFAARMIQHEFEHLDGGLFIDDLAPVRKKILSKRLQNISKGKVSTRYRTK